MKHIKQYFHWLYVVAPTVSIIIAYFAKVDEKIIEYIFIPLSFLINFVIILIKSKYQKKEDQNLIFSFLTNDLLPSKSDKFLHFEESKLVVIQHKNDCFLQNGEINLNSFYKKLERLFDKEICKISLDKDNKDVFDEIKYNELCKIKPSLFAIEIETKDIHDTKDLEDANDSLNEALNNAVAVIVVRTEELEKNSLINKRLLQKSKKWKTIFRSFWSEFVGGLLKSIGATKTELLTENLEDTKESWVYAELENWAYHNSNIAILFTSLKKEFQKSSIPKNYRRISDIPDTLSWKLVKRANDRGFAWRNVAQFNRLVATNLFALLLMGFAIGHFLIKHNENEFHENNQKLNELISLKNKENEEIIKSQNKEIDEIIKQQILNKELRNENYPNQEQKEILNFLFLNKIKLSKKIYEINSKLNESDFDISYWIRYNNEIRQLVKTEDKKTSTPFADNKKSVIGCGFTLENHLTKWVKGDNKITILDSMVNTIIDNDCSFSPENGPPPSSLACYSQNSTSPIKKEFSVGVCIHTRDETKNIFTGNYQSFLKKNATELFNTTYPLIQSKKLYPLANTN